MARYLEVDLANTFARASFVAAGGSPEERGAMAIHILLSGLLKINRMFKIDHMAFCLEGRSWRRKVDPKYKANRDAKRAAMTVREQAEQEAMYAISNDFMEFLTTDTNVTVLQHKDCEADDFIARFIQLHPNDEHIILSSDSDFRQLLADNVVICDVPNKRYFTNATTSMINITSFDREFKTEIVDDPEYFLFKKIIRGDSSDNIFSAYPRVRENGTKNKIGIRQAYEDKDTQGFDWQNFTQQVWYSAEFNDAFDPEVDDEDKRYIQIPNKVLDCYNHNKTLIDLREQPNEIKAAMDAVIVESVQKDPVSKIGFKFGKFCQKHDLRRISEQIVPFANMMGSRYGNSKV